MGKKLGEWGGKRSNAGRKPKLVKGTPRTKPCRITHHQCELIKSGRLEELENLLWHWHQKMKRETGVNTSPRWERMREFMGDVEKILGSDSDSWIDPVA